MTETYAAATVTERALTHDSEAEKLILGVLMADPEAAGQVGGDLVADDFYSPRHADIFTAIMEMYAAKLPTDPQAIAGHLSDRGALQRLGGAAYLSDCHQAAPLRTQLGYYVGRVVDLAEARNLEASAIQVVQAVTRPGRSLDDVADLAARLASKVSERRRNADMTMLGSLINPAFDRIDARKNRKAGIRTGFSDLDRMIGGLRKKQLVTIAGATSMGKSITLIDIARHVAIKERLTCAFFTLEMDNDEVFDRILAAESDVLHQHIRDGEMTDDDWVKVSKRIGPMANAPLFLSDVAPMNVQKIKRACEEVRRTHGSLDVVFVDHMHLVKPSSPRIVEERAILEDVANGLKTDLAMSLDVPVVAAAQLNRNPNARTDKTPQLSDLKGSSAIEQMSNVVVIVHRPEYYDAETPRAGEADFVLAKSRDGAKGIVTVAAQLHMSRFVDMAII